MAIGYCLVDFFVHYALGNNSVVISFSRDFWKGLIQQMCFLTKGPMLKILVFTGVRFAALFLRQLTVCGVSAGTSERTQSTSYGASRGGGY